MVDLFLGELVCPGRVPGPKSQVQNQQHAAKNDCKQVSPPGDARFLSCPARTLIVAASGRRCKEVGQVWGDRPICFSLAENAVSGWSRIQEINLAWGFTEGPSQYTLGFDVAFSGLEIKK